MVASRLDGRMALLWAADLRVCETWVGWVGEVADRIRSTTPQWVCPGLAATQATAWVSLWLMPPVLTPCAVGRAMHVVGSTEIAGGDWDGAAEPKCSLDTVHGCDVAAPSDGRPLRRWGGAAAVERERAPQYGVPVLGDAASRVRICPPVGCSHWCARQRVLHMPKGVVEGPLGNLPASEVMVVANGVEVRPAD